MTDEHETSRVQADIPRPALWLGIAGVLPFAFTAVQVASGWPLGGRANGPALHALLSYAAVILSFLGGVHWGLAMRALPAGARDVDWWPFIASVVPSLAAFGGLWLLPRNGLALLAGAFAVMLAYDLWTVSRRQSPFWYGRLRTGLSAAVLVCLLGALQLGRF